MSEQSQCSTVIRRDAVRIAAQPALIDCGAVDGEKTSAPIAAVPLLDGDRVAGFEIRCGCGASTIVECIYTEEPA